MGDWACLLIFINGMCESNVGQVLNRDSEPGVWFVLRRLITGPYHFAIRSFQQEYCLRLHNCLAKVAQDPSKLVVLASTSSHLTGARARFSRNYPENGAWSGLTACVILMAMVS